MYVLFIYSRIEVKSSVEKVFCFESKHLSNIIVHKI